MHQGVFGLAVTAALFGVQIAGDPMVVSADVSTASSGCELHVWPGSPLGSVYSGWFHGGLVNGAIDGRDGYPEVPPDPLDTPAQVALLGGADIAHLLKLDDHRIVMHEAALSSRVIRTTAGRIAGSASPCYAELVVDDVTLRQDVVTGSWLQILFRYRSFGTGDQPETRFATWVKAPLKRWKISGRQDADAAIEDLRAAYRTDITLFAEAATKPRKPAKHD